MNEYGGWFDISMEGIIVSKENQTLKDTFHYSSYLDLLDRSSLFTVRLDKAIDMKNSRLELKFEYFDSWITTIEV